MNMYGKQIWKKKTLKKYAMFQEREIRFSKAKKSQL